MRQATTRRRGVPSAPARRKRIAPARDRSTPRNSEPARLLVRCAAPVAHDESHSPRFHGQRSPAARPRPAEIERADAKHDGERYDPCRQVRDGQQAIGGARGSRGNGRGHQEPGEQQHRRKQQTLVGDRGQPADERGALRRGRAAGCLAPHRRRFCACRRRGPPARQSPLTACAAAAATAEAMMGASVRQRCRRRDRPAARAAALRARPTGRAAQVSAEAAPGAGPGCRVLCPKASRARLAGPLDRAAASRPIRAGFRVAGFGIPPISASLPASSQAVGS